MNQIPTSRYSVFCRPPFPLPTETHPKKIRDCSIYLFKESK